MKKLLKKIFIKLYNRLLEPENIKWEDKDYGNISMPSAFKPIYCNNFEKICLDNKYHPIISLLSFEILLEVNTYTLLDFIRIDKLVNTNDFAKLHMMNYNPIEVTWSKDDKYILIKIRGNLSFFKELCSSMKQNIIAKYIRTYLFPKGYEFSFAIEEKFKNEYIHGIDNPNKDIDILFIENDNFKDTLIGFSMKTLPTQLMKYHYITYNKRSIVIIPINKINITKLDIPEKYNTIISNIHTNIDPYSDIDEIIED